MGAGQSSTKYAEKYNDILDSMINHRFPETDDKNIQNISEQESKWFAEFENYIENNDAKINTDDALFLSINNFVKESQTQTKNILSQIEDPETKKLAETLSHRVKTAVVLQKYYEYKYLHLSAVFSEYNHFVKEVFNTLKTSITDAATQQTEKSTEELKKVISQLNSSNQTDTRAAVASISGIHQSSLVRLKNLREQMGNLTYSLQKEVAEFPAKQAQAQIDNEKRFMNQGKGEKQQQARGDGDQKRDDPRFENRGQNQKRDEQKGKDRFDNRDEPKGKDRFDNRGQAAPPELEKETEQVKEPEPEPEKELKPEPEKVTEPEPEKELEPEPEKETEPEPEKEPEPQPEKEPEPEKETEAGPAPEQDDKPAADNSQREEENDTDAENDVKQRNQNPERESDEPGKKDGAQADRNDRRDRKKDKRDRRDRRDNVEPDADVSAEEIEVLNRNQNKNNYDLEFLIGGRRSRGKKL